MDFHDPAGADPGVTDLIRYLFGVQCPDYEATVSDLVFDCHKRDLSLFLEIAEDLAMQCFLVGQLLRISLQLDR